MFNEKNYYIEKHEFPQDEIVIKTSNNGFICNSVGKINVVNCETYSVISNINEIIINVSYGDRKEEYFIDKTKEIKEKITKNQDSNV